MNLRAIAGLLLSSFFMGPLACTNGPDPGAPLAADDGSLDPRIISDRPLNRSRVIFTLKLNHPPLLESAEQADGGLKIPKQALEALTAEQDAVIAALKSLSPEIQILNRYRMILNAVAVSAPGALGDTLEKLRGVRVVEPSRIIGRPVTQGKMRLLTNQKGFAETSVSFIEATKVHQKLKTATGEAVRGQGIKVGVLDTGIDYTHRMLGGSGKEEDFNAINPAAPNAAFPNAKIVGGIDLVGTEYDAGSELPSRQLPVPDLNPIDEGGHGSHVAGTIAGIGDDEETYSGVAPDAVLHAIKVFGANGSTADYVVIAGLEYAADPNGDGDPSDHLDVVNLSLGSGFGQQNLYAEAIRTLTAGGVLVVASAGNSGPIDYIVGSPSTSTEAMSVAASVDGMPHNWTFPAIEFKTKENPNLLVRAIEGPISKPIDESLGLTGELVYIGVGDQALDDELKSKLDGKVAFVDRGKVPFLQKLKLAQEAGAIGAVVANNAPGDPIPMGGEGSVNIPAVMITKDVADAIKKSMEAAPVTVNFNTGKTIEDPRRIDTITSFSSKGPRSDDSLLKPEITAPGENIISAAMGSGDKGVAFSGTSMSGPHIAGVMALLRQVHPRLSAEELKSIAMSTAKTINDEAGNVYPLSLQGAGRVRSFAAATAPLSTTPASLSLGNVQVGESKTLRRVLTVKNISSETVTVTAAGKSSEHLRVQASGARSLEPGQTADIPVFITVNAPANDQPFFEMNAHLVLKSSNADSPEQRIPIMAIVTRMSQIEADGLIVHAASEGDSVDAHAELQLTNNGRQAGVALPFNLIGYDRRKANPDTTDSYRSRSCDLESAGYRIINKTVDGKDQPMLQIAVKLFEPTTTWNYCEVSVQIDGDGDHLAEQELVGIARSNLSGLAGLEFSSLLLDAGKAREIRRNFEEALAKGEEAPLSYVDAVLDVQPMRQFNHSTIAVIEAPLALLKTRPNGELAVKIATLYADTEGFEPDDFLSGQLRSWKKISSVPRSGGFYGMPESVTLAPGESREIALVKGAGRESLVVYMPMNLSARTATKSAQAKELRPKFVRTSRE